MPPDRHPHRLGSYFEYAIETVYNGGTIDQDWCKGIADGSVVMTT